MEGPPPREWGHLKDSAGFWVQAGGIVSTFGGVIAAGAASGGPAWAVPVGLGFVALGVGILLWAMVLRLAHRHALHHMCPDPSVHARQVILSAEEYKELLSERRETSEG